MFYAYLLRCRDGTLYGGWTTDLERRLRAHNSGRGAKYTRARLPVELVYWEELPSRRALSAFLTVNPNTVQKAYRLLEEEGLVQSHAGAKSFVCATREQRDALRRELTENELRGMVRDMKRLGLTAAEAALLVEKLYAEEESE